MNSPAKVLLIDIETSPILMAAWSTYEANAVWVERDTYILMFAYQWLGGKVQGRTLADYPGYRKNKHSDKNLCRDLWKLLDEADVVVAHNGIAFDIKKINSRLAVHGFTPPSPYKCFDTLREARRSFKFDSNKLDNLGRYLKEGRKLPNTGAALWRAVVNLDLKAIRVMFRYCKQDVRLLARVYKRLKPWAKNHPNLTIYSARPGCPVCQSTHVIKKGYGVALKRKYEQLKCMDCGHWFQGKTIKSAK